MNKIYKTVWNKARHCYVTVSELAKSQTKGCGARSLLVAAVVLGGLGASATVSAASSTYFGIEEGEYWVLQVDENGAIQKGSSDATGRVPLDPGSRQVTAEDYLLGNWQPSASTEAVTGGRVSFNGSEVVRIYGGMSGYISDNESGSYGNGAVSGNEVTFNGGKSQYVYGGSSGFGEVSGNKVEINGGDIKWAVMGGASTFNNATGNQVTVNDATITKDYYEDDYRGRGVYGGYSTKSADENKVKINGGKIYAPVYGGNSRNPYYHAYNNSVEMIGGEAAKDIYGGYSNGGDANENIVDVSGNAVIKGTIYGGQATYDREELAQTTDGNKVTVSGSASVGGDIYGGSTGGFIAGSHANNNTVTVSGNASTGNNTSTARIIGGVSGRSDAKKNQVIIKTENPDEKVSILAASYLDIMAGKGSRPESDKEHRGEASENSISFSGNVFVGLTGSRHYGVSIIAGYTDAGDAKDNSITIDINNGDNLGIGKVSDPYEEVNYKYTMVAGKGYKEVSGNSIKITKGKVYVDDIIAGYSYTDYSGDNVTDNHVTISGSDTDIKADTIYGGRSERNTNQALTDLLVQNNSVTITGSTVDGGVNGARAVSGAVTNNTVTISDANLENANIVYGGSFLMSDGGIVGGFTKYGNAADNSVSITNTTIGGDMAVVSGAYSEGDSYSEAGSAVARNTVILDKVTSTGVLAVAGAISDKATVGGESDGTAEKGNQVSITDSKVASVRGGISKLGDAKNNAVIIDGGTVTGDSVVVDGRIVVNGGVYGGQSNNASATGNTVKITNGADVKTNVYGGFAMNATGNAVEISGNGTTVEKDVYGGYIGLGGEYTGKTVTSNTVTLGGVSVGGSVYGGKVGYGKSDVVTDNKLILSAVGNTVGSDVQNFQTIELADTVAWRNGATVLAANAFKENNDTNKPRAGLDISAVQEAFGNETSGKMILLASNTADDFKTLSLTTTDGTDTLDENTQSKFLKQGASTTDAGVNGVTITSASTHSVTLDKANSYKNVLYTISGLASNVTLGNMTWGTPRDVSGDGLEFNAATAIDASGLTFSGTDTTLLKEGSTKTLVKGAVGITGNDIKQPGENKGTVAVEYTDTNNITFNATAKGTVGVDTNDVKYTVGSVTADKITLAEKVWGSAADNLPDSSWSASASTQIDATNFAYTGSANDALEAGVTETVINAKGLTKSSPVIEGTGKTVGVDVTDDNGINLIATATGHVAADKDKANYVVDSVALDTVNLGGWNGTGTSQVTATWTGTDVTVNTGKFALPTDMEAGESRDILTASATGFFSQGNISGDREYKEGSAFEPDTQNGVTLTGNQVGGVKAEDSGKKLTYYAMMKAAKTLTLGELGAFEADGTMATYGKGYDLTQAEISKDDLKFFDGITQAKKGESMTLVDATGATKNANGEALKAYADTYTVGYGEDVDGKALELEVTREDIIATNDKKTKLTYTVGDKTINTVAFTGAVAWDTEGAYYTNTQDTFNADTAIDASGLTFDPVNEALAANAKMTLISADGISESNTVTQPSAGTLDVAYTDDNGIAFEATAEGEVKAAAGAVNYEVTGVTVDKVNLGSWNGTGTSAVTEGWTGKSVAVETGSFDLPNGLAAGATKDIVTASAGFFSDDKIEGSRKYTEKALKDTQDGVVLAYSQTSGVKAEDNGAKLAYHALKNTGSALTLGEVAAFEQDGTAATYGKDFDLTGASINADGLSFKTGLDDAASGTTMTVVDASEAVKNEKGDSLQGFEDETFENTFDNEVKDALTLAGTRTDTLSQVDGQKLVYTVGDKNVETAAFNGTVAWNEGEAYYTNDGYTFSEATAIDASGLTFEPVNTALAADAKMTLISADGITADNKVTQPSTSSLDVAFTDDNGIAFNATAKGEVKAADGAVNYQVSGVGLNKVDLTAWDGSAASDVPDGWTLAEGATVETDGMNVPDVATGKQAAIVNSKAGFFANATINGENAYGSTDFNESDGGIQFAGTQEKGVTAASSGLVYKVGTKDVATATLSGTIAWNTDEAYYTNNEYTFKDKAGETEGSKIDLSGVTFTADADPLNQTMTLIGAADDVHAVKGTVSGAPDGFTFALDQGSTTLEATASGGASIEDGSLQYAVNSVTLDKVTVNSVGDGSVDVPEGWQANADGVAVDTDNMEVPADAKYGDPQTILTSNSALFDDANISGSLKFDNHEETFTDGGDDVGVTVAGSQKSGVKASDDGRSLVYAVGQKMVDGITLSGVNWQKDAVLLDKGSDEYNYSGVESLDGSLAVAYDGNTGKEAAEGQTMTLLKANASLKDIDTGSDTTSNYSYEDSGVTVEATITGQLAAKGGAVTYTVAKNQADRISFGNVDWKDSGTLLVRPDNISFNGAAVDTSNIYFTNRQALEANQQMTLVSNFDGKPGALTGTTYKVGTAYVGEGHAEFEDGNLYFMTDTGAGRLSDETHAPVMTMAAGLAMLAAGNDFIMKAEEGLKDTSVYVSVGGATSRYKTGSHVNTNTKNIIAAVGGKKGFEAGTLGVGVFAEYGEGNYKLHGSNTGGHGEGHYAGGGLLAKWTDPSNWYTEASIRLGRLSNDAKNILHDGAGRGYGYDKHTTYYGAHLGVGKVFEVDKGRSLDVYGKYFYTNYDGMNFTASGDRYKLDDVTSSIVRTGLRYASTDQRWNWYGGLAYEYEFDGEAKGKVNGDSVKSADLQGSSLRGEFGLKMDSTDTCPWKADIGVYGYTGKHRGVGGSVTVGYSF